MRKIGMGVKQNGMDLAAENARLKRENADLAAENARLKKALRKYEKKGKADAGEHDIEQNITASEDAEGHKASESEAPVAK